MKHPCTGQNTQNPSPGLDLTPDAAYDVKINFFFLLFINYCQDAVTSSDVSTQLNFVSVLALEFTAQGRIIENTLDQTGMSIL